MAGGGIIDFLGGQVEWLGFSEYRNIVGEGGIKGEFWVNLLMAVRMIVARGDEIGEIFSFLSFFIL